MKLQKDAHCLALLCWAPPARHPIVLKKPWECDRCLAPYARNGELRLVSGDSCQGPWRRGADGPTYRKRKSSLPTAMISSLIRTEKKKNDTYFLLDMDTLYFFFFTHSLYTFGCDHWQTTHSFSTPFNQWERHWVWAGWKDPGLQAAPTMYALHCEHVQRFILQCGALFIGDPSTQEAFTHWPDLHRRPAPPPPPFIFIIAQPCACL